MFELINRFKGEFMFDNNIESMVNSEERLLLICKARWIVILLLSVFGLITSISYTTQYHMSFLEYASFIKLPLITVSAMAILNTFYHVGWYKIPGLWKKHIGFFIKGQIIVDILFATTLIYITGGIVSWFWGLYILLTFELTYLIPSQFEVLAMGAFSSFLYTSLVALEYYNVIPYINPFTKIGLANSSLHSNFTYTLVAWLWVNVANFITAFVSTYMHGKEKLSVREKIVKDTLTGLFNRRYFNHALNSELARAERYGRVVSLLMIDIDDFKAFNDCFGHPAGDDLLAIVSRILKINVRRSEDSPSYDIDIICRYGGEEFAVILPETSTEESVATAKKLREEFDKHINEAYITAERLRNAVEETSCSCKNKITISIGIASYPYHASTSLELISMADQALYEAKKLGKNRTIVAKDTIDGIKNKTSA